MARKKYCELELTNPTVFNAGAIKMGVTTVQEVAWTVHSQLLLSDSTLLVRWNAHFASHYYWQKFHNSTMATVAIQKSNLIKCS